MRNLVLSLLCGALLSEIAVAAGPATSSLPSGSQSDDFSWKDFWAKHNLIDLLGINSQENQANSLAPAPPSCTDKLPQNCDLNFLAASLSEGGETWAALKKDTKDFAKSMICPLTPFLENCQQYKTYLASGIQKLRWVLPENSGCDGKNIFRLAGTPFATCDFGAGSSDVIHYFGLVAKVLSETQVTTSLAHGKSETTNISRLSMTNANYLGASLNVICEGKTVSGIVTLEGQGADKAKLMGLYISVAKFPGIQKGCDPKGLASLN